MGAAVAPVWVAALLLVLAGAPKVVRPGPTARAMRRLRVPATDWLVRLLGAAEAVLGVATLATGARPLVAAVAASYAAFTAIIVIALRRDGPLASCGCLGRADTPPTWAHAVVTAALAATATAAAATAGTTTGALAADWSPRTLAVAGYAGLATWCVWLVFTLLPHARLPRAAHVVEEAERP